MPAGRRTLVIDADVLSHARISGIGHSLAGLVRALLEDERASSRFHIRLLAPLDGVARIRQRVPAAVDIVRMPMPVRGWDRWMSLRALPPLDMFVGSGVFVFPHFGNWPLRRSRSITFVHDLAFLRHPETVGGNRGMLLRNAGRWIGRTDIVATVSEFSASELASCLGVRGERSAVIPWGVDTSVFHRRDAREIDAVARRHALPQRYILFLGDIAPRKNLARLVHAYRRLPEELRRAHPLVLVGGAAWNDGPIRDAIDGARSAGDTVLRVPTYVEDDEIPALISGAAMLAHPSLYEGFGITPLQAMACEVPVLGGDNSSQPEVIGDAGVLVDALDVDAIARGLQTLLADEPVRQRLVQAGRARVRAFTWRRSVDAFLQAVDRLSP